MEKKTKPVRKTVKKAEKKETAKKAEPKAEAKPKSKQKAKRPSVSEAIILSYRRGRYTQKSYQYLLELKGVKDKDTAKTLLGMKVVWSSPSKKNFIGKVTRVHGRNGIVAARFSKGLPGIALMQKVKVLS